jgi:NADH-quinone oxidoreductase subunit J
MTAGLFSQIDSAAGTIAAAAPASHVSGIFASLLYWSCVLLAVGLWFSMPRGGARGRNIGLVLVVVSLGLIATQLPLLVGWLDQGLFTVLAAVTVLSCVAAIISRSAVYAAIWFGLALLGTAGLFLLVGAQFLSVATVTVYAGAILVTFLFVIMLAQPRGHAHYDRVSWEAFLSAAAGAILVGLLTAVIGRGIDSMEHVSAAPALAAGGGAPESADNVLAENHVALLGRELLGRHLIAMQAAGALMLAALVGAMAVVAHGHKSAASVGLAAQLYHASDHDRVILPHERSRLQEREAPGGIHA